jgi:hypothetical protein
VQRSIPDPHRSWGAAPHLLKADNERSISGIPGTMATRPTSHAAHRGRRPDSTAKPPVLRALPRIVHDRATGFGSNGIIVIVEPIDRYTDGCLYFRHHDVKTDPDQIAVFLEKTGETAIPLRPLTFNTREPCAARLTWQNGWSEQEARVAHAAPYAQFLDQHRASS